MLALVAALDLVGQLQTAAGVAEWIGAHAWARLTLTIVSIGLIVWSERRRASESFSEILAAEVPKAVLKLVRPSIAALDFLRRSQDGAPELEQYLKDYDAAWAKSTAYVQDASVDWAPALAYEEWYHGEKHLKWTLGAIKGYAARFGFQWPTTPTENPPPSAPPLPGVRPDVVRGYQQYFLIDRIARRGISEFEYFLAVEANRARATLKQWT